MIAENINTDTEEIEGLGKDEDASLSDYPIDTLQFEMNHAQSMKYCVELNREAMLWISAHRQQG